VLNQRKKSYTKPLKHHLKISF